MGIQHEGDTMIAKFKQVGLIVSTDSKTDLCQMMNALINAFGHCLKLNTFINIVYLNHGVNCCSTDVHNVIVF